MAGMVVVPNSSIIEISKRLYHDHVFFLRPWQVLEEPDDEFLHSF